METGHYLVESIAVKYQENKGDLHKLEKILEDHHEVQHGSHITAARLLAPPTS